MIKKLIGIIVAVFLAIANTAEVFADVIMVVDRSIGGTFYGGFDTEGDYLYIPDALKGVLIVDISNPMEYKQIATAQCDIPYDRGITVYNGYLYAQDSGNVLVFDVRNPEKPKKVASASLLQGGHMAAYGNTLAVGGQGYVQLYDISKPKMIYQLSSVANPNPSWYYGMKMDDSNIYFMDNKFNFVSIDYTNREKPFVKKVIKLESTKDFAEGYFPSLCDGVFYVGCKNENKLYGIDVSNSDDPSVIMQQDTDGVIQATYADGNTLYIAVEGKGIYRYEVNKDHTLSEKEKIKSQVGCDFIVKDGRYFIYNTFNSLNVSDLNGSFDTAGMPTVISEAELLGKKNGESESMPFDDVREHWSLSDVNNLYEKRIVDGVSEHKYEPDRKISRAEFGTIIVKTLAMNIERYMKEFTDVSEDSWYCDIIETCVKSGILIADEKDKTVRPEEFITREEAAWAAAKAIELSKKNIADSVNETNLSDIDSVSEWAKESVSAVLKWEIMTGDDNGLFRPADGISRGETAAVINRMYKALFGEEDIPEFLDNNKYDIENNKEAEFTDFAPDTKMPYDTKCPQIIKVSDAIEPDELFNIYGEQLPLDSEVYIIPTEQIVQDETPNLDIAQKVEVIGGDEEKTEKYITCRAPQNMNPGSYYLYVSNKNGFAKPVYLNAARPQWIDREEAAAGQRMRILGKNLDAREFGAELATNVVFIKGGNVVKGELVSVNPYCIEVMPPDGIEEGEYAVAVTNDGKLWFEPEEDKTICLKNKIDDPFNLEMPWADRFDYTVKADITKPPYNAPRDGSINISELAQKAIDDVKKQGGGVVYFPEGIYKLAALELPADVIVMGDGMEKTILQYSSLIDKSEQADEQKHLGNFMFHSKDDGITDGRQGLHKFQITLDQSCPAPDHYIWFGSSNWGPEVSSINLRTNKYVFISEIKLNTPMIKKADDGRAFGSVQMINSHYLIKDSIFYGNYSTATTQEVGKYTYMINTNTTSSVGNTYVTGSRVICEGNVINRHIKYSSEINSAQGIFLRDHAYSTENVIRGTGMPGANDGEVICSEVYMGGTKLRGYVSEADSDSFKYNTEGLVQNEIGGYGAPTDIDKYAYNDGWYVTIISGKGLGQYRRVSAIDKESNSVKIDGEWDILPDKTSYFVISLPEQNVTIYNNYANNGAKGLWLFGECHDGVVARNNIKNIEGAYIWTSTGSQTLVTNMFARFDGNVTEGYGSKGENCGIGVSSGMETDSTPYVLVYGTEIRDNYMTGGKKPGRGIPDGTEAPNVDGIYMINIVWKNQSTTNNTIKGTIIEGNTVNDMETGIVLGQDPGWYNTLSPNRAYTDFIYCKDNKFNNVKREFVDDFNKLIFVE